ncbi:restriction endonuclease subunit S [Aggregatibacter aphrophilus]|uniref:restriction endonuclease subunit S n=1 Tax=Aggregatibacter kilianii TaxID=2025884 RepID=UPI000D65CBC0|nr:restriction endonuclease subunit S [Aggregatibacter kilianii]RDE87954.1 restriction endonuclease subunit S [Aggregatibacter aphrophilus]
MNSALKNYATYVNNKIDVCEISLNQYISTDNILQNKQGIECAASLPIQGGKVTAFKKGDILLANIRPYLKKIWYAQFDGGCSADVLAIRANAETDSHFLFYALFRDDFFIHAMKGAKGTKMPRGDKAQIMEFKIPVFDLKTQQSIAAVLSTLDKKIALNKQINARLEEMAKILYDYWFVQFDFPDANGKPYKSSGGEMVFDETLKRKIPKGWEVKSLWKIAKYFNGLALQKYRPENELDDFLPVIKIREMNEGVSSNTERAKTNIPKEAIIDDGDILFSWSATLEIKIWSQGKGALNQHIFKVTSSEYPKYFFYFELLNYLKHFKMIADLRKTTMGHITQDHLKQAYICIPSQPLLEKLEKIVTPIFQKMLITQKQNHQLTQLRDFLLPMLMNGQVSVAE